jgi:hypothetical protein
MMTHDPFQNYQTLGQYAGAATPYGLPYTALQPTFNPMGMAGQPQIPGIGGYGIYPNPLQGLSQIAPLQQLLALNSLVASLHNPLLHQQSPWHNHLLAAGLQNPQTGYPGWPQQPQSNYPLAPQTLLGAGGIGQPYAQQFGFPQVPQGLLGGGIGQNIHPLAQLALRQATGYGISPLAGCF